MYENVGGKIKGVATTAAIIGIIATTIGFIALCLVELVVAGFLVLIVGCLVSWLSSLALYGLGQLIENSDKIANNMRNMESILTFKVKETSVGSQGKSVIDDIDTRKDRLAKWLEMGVISQAEYNSKCKEISKMESNVNADYGEKTFEQLIEDPNITSEQRAKIRELKGWKDEGLISTDDCRGRIQKVLSDQPLDVVLRIINKL